MSSSGRGVIQEDNLGTVIGDRKAQLGEMLAAYVAESGKNSFYLRMFAGMCRGVPGCPLDRPFDSKPSIFKDEREELIKQAYDEMKVRWSKAEIPKPSDWRYGDVEMKSMQQAFFKNSAVVQLKQDLTDFFTWMNQQQQRAVFTPDEINRIEELLIEGLVFQIGSEHSKGQNSKKIEDESTFIQALTKVIFKQNPAQDNYTRKMQHFKFPPDKTHYQELCSGKISQTGDFNDALAEYTYKIVLSKDFRLMTKEQQVSALTTFRDDLIAKAQANSKKDEIVKAINDTFNPVINIYNDGFGRDYESLQRAKEIANKSSPTQEERNYVEHITKMLLRMDSDDKPSLKIIQKEVIDSLKGELEKAKTLVTNKKSEGDLKMAENIFKSILSMNVNNNQNIDNLKFDVFKFVSENKEFSGKSGLLDIPSQNEQLKTAINLVNESHHYKKSSDEYEERRKGAELYFRNVLQNGNKHDKAQAVQFLRQHHVFARDNKLGGDVKKTEVELGIKATSSTREKFNQFKAAAVDAKRSIAETVEDAKVKFRRR